jgi:hypothetical protein
LSFNIGKKILKYVIVISEVDLCFTSLLLLVRFNQNIALFLVSAAINVCLNIIVENHTNRKIESYHSSQTGSLLFNFLQIILYLGNSITASIAHPLYFYFFNILMSLLMFKWYLSFGIRLYIHTRPVYFTMFYLSLHLTFTFLFIERIILKKDIFLITNIAKFILAFALMFLFCYFTRRRKSILFK